MFIVFYTQTLKDALKSERARLERFRSLPRCGARLEPWVCTLAPNHDGSHLATVGHDGSYLAEWFDMDATLMLPEGL